MAAKTSKDLKNDAQRCRDLAENFPADSAEGKRLTDAAEELSEMAERWERHGW